MMDTSVVPGLAVLASVAARFNQASTLQAVAGVLGDKSVQNFAEFDYCCLVLPLTDSEGHRLVHVSPSAPASSETGTVGFDAARTLYAGVIAEGKPVLLEADELQRNPVEGIDAAANCAMLLPLTTDERCFGVLCVASTSPNAYGKGEAKASLQWLAATVALAVQAALLREELEAASGSLHEVSHLKSGFVNTLVRDIRLPLTSVLGLLELFETKLETRERFDSEDRHLLYMAIEQSDRMRHLVDDLLEVTQGQERPLTLNYEHVEVEQLLTEATAPAQGEAALRGVEITVRVAAELSALHIDARQMRRALRHILTAALAASHDGGRVQVEAQSFTGTRFGDAGRRFVLLTFTDSGDGVPAEEVPFIFDAFWHAAKSHRSAAQGVGLAVAKRIVATHGGNVAVRSQLGAGTVYSVVLPTDSQTAPATATKHVLIVDDTPELLLLLGKHVERMGYQVTMAATAERALEALNEQKVNLVVTEWFMEGMGGAAFVERLKRDFRWRSIPVVAIASDEMVQQDALRAGCERFLVRPVKRDELQEVINELVSTQTNR